MALSLLTASCAGDSEELTELKDQVEALEEKLDQVTTTVAPTTSATATTTSTTTTTTTTTQTPTTAAALRGLWTTQVDTSPIDDSKTIYLALDAMDEVTSSWGVEIRPTLVLRCKAGTIDVYLRLKTEYELLEGPLLSGTWTSLRVRFDNDRHSSVRASLSTDSQSAFFLDSNSIIKQIQDATTLLIEVTPYMTTNQVVTFYTSHLDYHLPELVDACPTPAPTTTSAKPRYVSVEEAQVELSREAEPNKEGTWQYKALSIRCYVKVGEQFYYGGEEFNAEEPERGVEVEFELFDLDHPEPEVQMEGTEHEFIRHFGVDPPRIRASLRFPDGTTKLIDTGFWNLPDQIYDEPETVVWRFDEMKCQRGNYQFILAERDFDFDAGWISETVLSENFRFG